METIVKKLNEKALDIGAEGNAKTVVDALNQIVEATGGTPSTTNKITDAIEKIQFGEGGGSGEISDENCIEVEIDNQLPITINLKWCSGRNSKGYFACMQVISTSQLFLPYVLKSGGMDGGKFIFCAYITTSSSLPINKMASVSCDNGGDVYVGDIKNKGGYPLEMLVYVEWDANVESPTITFSLVDEGAES